MRKSSAARAGGVLFALVFVLGAAQSAVAQPVVGGTNVWTMVGAPSMITFQGNVAAQTMFSNTVNSTILGIVYIVVRNSLGQNVFAGVGTTSISGLQIGTAIDILFNVPNGSYTATFFATNTAGVAISTTTSLQITLPLA